MNQYDMSLLQENLITIGAVFDNDFTLDSLNNRQSNQSLDDDKGLTVYTFKADASMNIAVGDWVLVDASGRPKVVRVVEVHDYPQIDAEMPFTYRWVIQKIDFSGYQRRVLEDKYLAKILDRLAFIKNRQALMKRLSLVQEEDGELRDLLIQWRKLSRGDGDINSF